MGPSDPSEPTTWGENAVVCDPWAHRCFLSTAFNHPREFELIQQGKPKPFFNKDEAIELLQERIDKIEEVPWVSNASDQALFTEIRKKRKTEEPESPVRVAVNDGGSSSSLTNTGASFFVKIEFEECVALNPPPSLSFT